MTIPVGIPSRSPYGRTLPTASPYGRTLPAAAAARLAPHGHPAAAVRGVARDRGADRQRPAWSDRLRVVRRPGGPRPRGRRRPPHRWRVLLWRLRVPFAATMLGCAVALALDELRPPAPERVPVVVAAHAVAAGAPLAASDLAVVQVPPAAVPDGAHGHPDAVLGRTPVVGVAAGLPLVDALLGGDGLAAAGPPGTVVVPVRLADAGVAGLLRPGDRVDLFAAATSGSGAPVAERLAERALVLPHPAGSVAPDSPGLLSGAPEETGTLTVVAVAPGDAPALAGAPAWAGITAVVVE